MVDQKLEAHKINKPFQLLAAWLVGLVIVNGTFLTAARLISEPIWLRVVLVIASVINVPCFLICIFLLQTKFRPEMQDDKFYSEHLKQKYNSFSGKIEVYSEETKVLSKEIKELTISNTRLIRMVEDVQEQVAAFTYQTLYNNSDEMCATLFEGDNQGDAGSIIGGTNSMVHLKQSVNWDYVWVEVNDLLPKYKEIREKLASKGIRVRDTFGSNSFEKEVPSRFTLTVGLEIDIEHIQEIVKILLEFGLDSIDYANHDHQYNSMCVGKMYIGSYGYEQVPVISLNDSLVKEFLSPSISEERFWEILNSK